MRIVYAIEEYDFKKKIPSIFLAGPTPRSPEIKSWRPEAIELLKENNFPCDVFIPETEDGEWQQTYMDQIEWELKLLNNCTAILMWVPRDLETMPSFTTNVEFGMFVKSGQLYYGRPDNAPKNKYLDYCYTKYNNDKPQKTLKSLVKEVVKVIR